MKSIRLLFTWLIAVTATLASSGEAVLTLVNEPEFNEVQVDVVPPFVPSKDTTFLSGTLRGQIEVDTDTDTVRTLIAEGGNIVGSAIDLNRTGVLLRYNANSTELGIDITTLTPPSRVDSSTGDFDASDHQFIVNSGTLSGQVHYLGASTPIDQDFGANPFGSRSEGTGNVSLELLSSTPTSKTYAVTLIYPVSTNSTLSQSGLTVNILTSGTAKATGTLTVPLPTAYDRWRTANSIDDPDFGADSNGDGVPNGVQWALGLNADALARLHLPTYDRIIEDTVHYTLNLPENGSAADLTVLFTPSLRHDFAPLPSTAVNTGNPIPSGSAGTVTIDVPSSRQGYFLLQAKEP